MCLLKSHTLVTLAARTHTSRLEATGWFASARTSICLCSINATLRFTRRQTRSVTIVSTVQHVIVASSPRCHSVNVSGLIAHLFDAAVREAAWSSLVFGSKVTKNSDYSFIHERTEEHTSTTQKDSASCQQLQVHDWKELNNHHKVVGDLR